MTKYNKHLSEPWFTLVKLGLKTCEGRLNKGSFSNMKQGDIIEFENSDFSFKRVCKREIKTITYHNTFNDYLKKETLKKCLPGIDRINDGLNIYYKYFTKEDEKKYGVIALSLIKSN